MYAIIRSGNKQYRVEKGDRIQVERLPQESGAEVTLTDILMVGDGDQHKADKESLGKASVKARVLGEKQG